MFDLKPRLSGDGSAEATPLGWLLSIPPGSRRTYRLAQIDDHLSIARSAYPWQPSIAFQLEARVSSAVLPGTWGFGLWNDPYGFSFGPGNGFLRLPALPNAAWFFYSSPICYLSFRDDLPGNGLLAQSFSSHRSFASVLRAAAALPFSRRWARRILSRVIAEDAVRVSAPDPDPDITQWHQYRIEWLADRTRCFVDDECILDSPVSPRSPLGLVIWIDNQYAGFFPDGRISWGLEENPAGAWLELRDIRIQEIA